MIMFDMKSQHELLRIQDVQGYSLIQDSKFDDLLYIILMRSQNSILYCQISQELDFNECENNNHHLHHLEEILMLEEFSGEITDLISYFSQCGAVFQMKIIEGKITTKQISLQKDHLNINEVIMFSMIEVKELRDNGVLSKATHQTRAIAALIKQTTTDSFPEIQIVSFELEKNAQTSTKVANELQIQLPTSISASRDSIRIWRLSQHSFCFLVVTPDSTYIQSQSVFLPSPEGPLKILEDININSVYFPGYFHHSTIGPKFLILQSRHPLKSSNQDNFILLQLLFNKNRYLAIQFKSSSHTSLEEIHLIINQQEGKNQQNTKLITNKLTFRHLRSTQKSPSDTITSQYKSLNRITEEKEKSEKVIKTEVSSNTPKIIKIVCGVVGGIIFIIFLVVIVRIVRSHLLKNAQEMRERQEQLQQQNQVAQQQKVNSNTVQRMQQNPEQMQQPLGQQQQQPQQLLQPQQQPQQIPMDQQQIQQFIQNNNMIFSLLLNSQNFNINNNEGQGGQLDPNQQKMLISALLLQQQQQQQFVQQSNSTSLGVVGQIRKESSSDNHESANVIKQLSQQSISRLEQDRNQKQQHLQIQRQQEQETITDHPNIHQLQEKDEYYNNREQQELPYLSAPLKIEQINPELSINQSIDKLNANNFSQMNNEINIHNESKIGSSVQFKPQYNNSQLLREKFEKELIGLLASQLPNLPSAELQQQQYLNLQRNQQAAQFIVPPVNPPPEYEEALEDLEGEEDEDKIRSFQQVEKDLRDVQDGVEKMHNSELHFQEKDLHENVEINGQNYELKQPELEKLNGNNFEKKNKSQLENNKHLENSSNEQIIEDTFALQPKAQPSQRPQRYADMKDKLRNNQDQQQYNPLRNTNPEFSTDTGNIHDDYFKKFSNNDHNDEKHQALCCMCLCNPPMIVFDCGHVLCQACSTKVKNCLFCQVPLQNPRRIAFV